MTNITYFYNAVRDDDSVSTTSTDNEVSQQQQQQQQPNSIVQEAAKAYIGASSVYSAIGNACLACTRPPIELVDDTSLIGTSNSVSPGSQSEGGNLEFSNLKSFSNDELKAATWNFGLDNVFREGSLGVVMGWLNQHNLTASKPGMGIAIAVKRLNPGVQSNTEWLASVNHLRRLYHPNLVRLIGYCLEAERQLLVYEFTHQGSLEKHLFRRGSYRKPLTWSLRVSVALDAAKGLSFLHKAEVIHGDFKPSNILLDSNYNAKLCDFGLAKDSRTSMIETTYRDTYVRLDSVNDYAAPEYLLEGCLSAKSDVYSFGVVLLEILFGRRTNKNLALRGKAHFTSDLLHKDKLPSLMDRCLEGQYSVRGAQRLAHLALRCINKSPTSRPTMDIVVTTLQTIQDKMS